MQDERKSKKQLVEELKALRARLSQAEESERFLKALMEHIPEGITLADASFMRIHSMSWFGQNLSGGHMHGGEPLSIAEYTNRLKLFHPDAGVRAQMNEYPIVRALQGEKVVDEEWVLRRPDGVELVILCNAGPIRNNAGDITGGVVAWRDITGRKSVEEALKEVKERLHLSLQASGFGTWSWDVGAGVAICDGYPHPVFGGRSGTLMVTREDFLRAVHPEDRERIKAEMGNSLANQSEFHMEYRVVRSDGSERSILDRGRVYRDEEGNPTRMAGVCLDITNLKRMEEDLRLRKEHLKLTFDQAPIGAGILGLDYRIHRANAELCRLTGYSEEEMLHLSLVDITHPEDIGANLAVAERLVAGEIGSFQMEKRYVRKDGTTAWGNLLTRMVRDAQGNPLHILSMVEDITDRKQMEEALRKSEQRMRKLVEANIIGIILANDQGEITEANEAFLKIVGYNREDLLEGKVNWIKMTPPEYEQRDLQAIEELKENGFCMPFEKEYVRKDGRRAPILIGLARLGASDEEEVVSFVLDLSEPKRMEEALRESETRHRLLFESMAQGVIFHDSNGDVTAINPAAEAILGVAFEEIRAKHLASQPHWKAIHEDGSGFESHECPALAALKTAGIVRDVIMGVFNRRENAYRWIRLNSIPQFRSGEVKPHMVYSIFEDITEIKKARESLEEANAALDERVKERTADLVKVNTALRDEVAERRRIEAALRLDDARLEALLSLSQMAEDAPQQIADFVLERGVSLTQSKTGFLGLLDEKENVFTLQASAGDMARQCGIRKESVAVEGAELWAEAIRRREPLMLNDYSLSESIPCSHLPPRRLLSVPILSDGRIVAAAVVADKEEEYDQSDARQLGLLMDGMWKILLRKRAEAALRESESLAAMGRALSSVAHDLKTPLVAIGGFTRLVQNHLGEESPYWKKLDIVLKETGRLEWMVKEMLDFSRPLELNRLPEDLNRVIEESLEVSSTIANKRKVEITMRLDPDLPLVLFDPMRMKQVIINLVTNAIEASPRGTSVSVSTGRSRGLAFLDIADCGCGIPVDKREEIFVPFVSTKKKGSGLGLPIVKKIVEAHCGSIQIIDNPTNGVIFRVALPIQ